MEVLFADFISFLANWPSPSLPPSSLSLPLPPSLSLPPSLPLPLPPSLLPLCRNQAPQSYRAKHRHCHVDETSCSYRSSGRDHRSPPPQCPQRAIGRERQAQAQCSERGLQSPHVSPHLPVRGQHPSLSSDPQLSPTHVAHF